MNRRLLKFGIPLLALATLLVAIPVLTAAASPGQKKVLANVNKNLHTVRGEVTYISGPENAASIAIVKEDDQAITITTNATTEYYLGYTGKVKQTLRNRFANLKNWFGYRYNKDKDDEESIPKNWGNQLGKLDPSCKNGSFTDLNIGDCIIARVDNNNVASRILIVNVPVVRQVKGTITIVNNTVSVLTTEGTTISSLKWDVNTRFIIKGTLSVPTSGYGIVTYNTESMTALCVNMAVTPPTSP